MNDLPSDWARTTVGAVASIHRGVTYRKGDASARPASGLVPLLRATNISEQLSLDDCVYVPAGLVSEQQLLREGDIVMAASSGSASVVGKSAQLSRPWRGSFGAFCACIRPGPNVSPRYLAWFLASDGFRRRASRLAAGSNINNLKRKHISETPVPLPPRDEQDRIVAAIEQLMTEVKTGLRAIEVSAGAVAGLRRAALQTSTADGNEMTVGDVVAVIEAGRSFRCQSRPASHDEWGVIKVSAMTWGAFNEDENKAVLPGTEIDERWEIRPGDLLLSRANTTAYVGASVFIRDCRPHLLLSDKSLRLLPAKGILAEWLHAALSAPTIRAQISAMATGTKDSMRNISQAKLRRVRIRVPTLARQREIVADLNRELAALDRAARDLEEARKRSRALERAILATAMTGALVDQEPPAKSASELARIREGGHAVASEPEGAVT